MTLLAAVVASLIFVLLAAFQAALALGAPLGRFAWGGQAGDVLPPRLQVASAASVPVLLAMSVIVLIRAGVLYSMWSPAMYWPCWAVFLFLTLNTFANLGSKSQSERRLMTPIAAIAAIAVLYTNVSA
ncbi:hypothetical protein GCM10007989_00400 [Devosia pacifica]|uniref:Uncharacterized protein n=1 Tax=Devosia pacifica TaxID=1335967 RepID=A0A918VMC3_9HYPH|nr:hypothetical protein [Devosia pacifica]GHA10212.1 hypothetical protein GCM10007989_00400 [Devosia pacifica]